VPKEQNVPEIAYVIAGTGTFLPCGGADRPHHMRDMSERGLADR